MRKYLSIIVCLTLLVTYSCTKDNNTTTPESDDIIAAKKTFSAMFPKATGSDWSVVGNFNQVDFNNLGQDMEAWFNLSGAWVATESPSAYNLLPKAVQNSMMNSWYAFGWTIDDVERLVRYKMDTIFMVDMEQSPKKGTQVYTAGGILLSEVIDTTISIIEWLPITLPTATTSLIEQNYPGSTLAKTYATTDTLSVDIIDSGVLKNAYFNPSSGAWFFTRTAVSRLSVPPAVISAWQTSSTYASYALMIIYKCQSPTQSWYRLMLSQNAVSVAFDVLEDGTIIGS